MFIWVNENNDNNKKLGLHFYNFVNDLAFSDVKFDDTRVYVASFDCAGYNITLFTLASKNIKI